MPPIKSSDLSQIFIPCRIFHLLLCLLSISFFLSTSLSLFLLLFLCGKSVARMIECVACFSVNNCRRVRLAELHRLHRRGDGQDLDVRARWRILDFEWVSLQRLQYKQTSLLLKGVDESTDHLASSAKH